MKKIVFFFLFVSNFIMAQSLYKTPSGHKYHLETCRMVKNVSEKISQSDIMRLKLSPCKICKPPYIGQISNTYGNKAVGESRRTVQCKGYTKKGTRCKHKTSIANGYCFQHTNQGS